jgi:uncharacterized protein YbaR (Trm112 family)
MTIDEVESLRCPLCRERVSFSGSHRNGAIATGVLECAGCARRWEVRDGLPRMVDEAAVSGPDWLMRLIYDNLAILHDPAVHVLLPVLQFSTAADLRDGYMRRLELDALRQPRGGRPLRILEVGAGTGANLPLLERDLPPDLDVELWISARACWPSTGAAWPDNPAARSGCCWPTPTRCRSPTPASTASSTSAALPAIAIRPWGSPKWHG